ncbi:MAG: PD-(D/E)XK nuclease family protein [Bacteroidales bacterium]|nr:PD-(D/E)XK nuclease family protein [Candidatus Cryptobacteroides equifaecalis]
MTPFLKQVADHYRQHKSFADLVFIFPNRRSLSFFRKYVSVPEADVPMLEPRMYTINDFFCTLGGRSTSDRISLLLSLYDCYSRLNPHAESLDDFIYWGDVILGDFDDTDKYLIDAKSLFSNISDLKGMKDDFSYLSEEQAKAIKRLASHFSSEHWIPGGDKDVKKNFLMIWNLLLPLYSDFRRKLSDEGTAYEGMIYRDLAERMRESSAKDVLKECFQPEDRFVFIGLNALNECEKAILGKMRDAGLAEFCWDYPGQMIKTRGNAATHFMERNLQDFKNAFDIEGAEGKPAIHVISVPSATGQAKLLPGMIQSVPENERELDFAVVLPDETMLMPVLNSIPAGTESINITMGYPLASSEFYAFMREVLSMQSHLRNKGGKWYFYHRQVHTLFSSGILKAIMGDADNETVANVRKGAKYYIPAEDLAATPLFRQIFTPVVTDLSSNSPEQIRALEDYLLGLTTTIASALPEEDALQIEYARKYFSSINRLRERELPVLPKTWIHLAEQICAGQTVSFDGDPLGGLQIMGPLETRALDFRHLVILNTNENVFPRRSFSSSFIPPELRSAFNLPTYEYQESVWAYYFYRLIARASNVWLVYDSRTEGLRTGEESRYIKQLEYLYPELCSLDWNIAKAKASRMEAEGDIPKTDEDIKEVEKAFLSASSIQKYISCPASFYYYVVKKLRADDEITETLDASTLGTVCHDTLQALYTSEEQMSADIDYDKRKYDWEETSHLEVITADYLKGWLKRKDEIRNKIFSLIRYQIHSIEVSGRNLIDADIALQFVLKVIQRDIELIERHGPLKIHGLEKKYLGEKICGQSFMGFIDRLDSFRDGTIRIVDYKTGRDNPEVLATDDPTKFTEKLFSPKYDDSHDKKAALQFFIYDKFVRQDKSYAEHMIFNSMYAMGHIFSEGIEISPESPDLSKAIEEKLQTVLDEIKNPEIPFRRTTDEKSCKWCDFKALCGKTIKE